MFNTNNNMTSEGSNFGYNNIIFNNFGSINNNIFIENNQIINQRDNTQNEDKKKEKIIRNFNFLKENIIKEDETNNNKEKEKDDLIKK